jgi:hemoglobin-like flavoprotein
MKEEDRNLIKATWKVARKNGNIAPKAFIRYFKLKPETQKKFPAFADVDLADLPTNMHFLNQAFTCVSGLNAYIDNLGKNPKNCPYLTSPKLKAIKPDELQLFGQVMFNVMEEELGQSFSTGAKKAWKNGLTACDIAFRKSQ